ncbi:RebB family R body protein [Chryseobacterium daeguense]|uniref:RebB family R body protein n=1 Tax=Chryseobacterium daeguense TaxID=412438 RepID=UPI000429CD6C|nr:RebB family R body protein [Chryseobacterium daeguense]
MSEEEKKSAENDQPQSVNDQITDAVSITNVMNIGEHPAFVYSQVYQTAAHSTGIMFENSINNQNNQNILGQAATAQGIMQIYSLDSTADGISVEKLLNPIGGARVEPTSEENKDKKNND